LSRFAFGQFLTYAGIATSTAVTVIKTTDGSAYTGLTAAFIGGKLYFYVSNFAKGRVDVYDSTFQRVNLSKHSDRSSSDEEERSRENPFLDERLPRGYVPFNVQAIGKDIIVTYVLHEPSLLAISPLMI